MAGWSHRRREHAYSTWDWSHSCGLLGPPTPGGSWGFWFPGTSWSPLGPPGVSCGPLGVPVV
eukprot:3225088-Pyramimonas_sp.AAC.1